MATLERSAAVDPAILADLEAVRNPRVLVRDRQLLARLQEPSDRARQETLEKFGVQEIGAEIIRATQDE